ncbi:MAG: 3D domain-containing protein [Elusimicrobiota bacterium]|jgi:3D (Asp-Asp-Asp) domain-containing protein|nr:3D domain-containing protein [Elusimicrobiota bacterium]
MKNKRAAKIFKRFLNIKLAGNKISFVITIMFRCFVILAMIFCLSKILSFMSFARNYIFISVDNNIYVLSAYKNIPLQTILDALDISLGEDDLISQEPISLVSQSLKVAIIRVSHEQRFATSKKPYRVLWSRKYLANLRPTELQKGIETWTKTEFDDIFYDGKLFETENINEKKVELVYYRLLLLDKKGNVESSYDLYKSKTLQMISTAYYAGDPFTWGDGTITFLGDKMQRGIVAVDPKTIPLRTRLFVSGYGYGYAGDTGNAIKGNRVDLGVNGPSEEKAWAFRNVTIYLLESSDTW